MINKITGFLRSLGGQKVYLLAMALFYGFFLLAELQGRRIIGDDNNKTEQHSATGGQHFYHK
jgi:hypothetical protein